MGRRKTLLASARSTITTWSRSLIRSRTQINRSDSSVSVWVDTELGSCFNCKISQQAPAVISMKRTSAVLRRFTWNEIEAGWTPRLDN